jgi:alpha-D-xyloside xylohydrolase
VTSNNESYLRPLFSDFAQDRKVWDIADEFMFGRSILACPILDPQYTEEKIVRTDAMTGWDRKETSGQKSEVGDINWTESKTATKYLPKGAVWYDFWTGKTYKGGKVITLETSLDRVPMFVRAGSILPLGPEMQYVGEKAWDNLEIRVYPGANGSFTLYEDEGDNYNYEKGYYATITFTWNDKARQLTIGTRQGGYKGMILDRQFTIVLPDGTSRTVSHNGNEQIVQL